MLTLAGPAPSHADTQSDFRIQSDRATAIGVDRGNDHALDDTVYLSNYRYLKTLLRDGYPLHSVILHAVARGMTVSDVAYYLALARPDAAEEIVATLTEVLPRLPSWVCSSELEPVYYQRATYDLASLSGKPTIRSVAQRFFTEGRILSYQRPDDDSTGDWEQPDWSRGEYHFKASIDELIALAQADTFDGEQGWWYQPGKPIDANGPVFVSLYRRDGEIVVDVPLATLREIKQAGVTELPVIIVFNAPEYLPTYRIKKQRSADAGESGPAAPPQPGAGGERITIADVAAAYFDQPFIGARVTPTREWHDGDYHIMASLAEIKAVLGLPTLRNVPESEQARYRAQLAQGFASPLKVTLFGDAGKMWLDNPARAAVAADMGITDAPVVFLYHDFRRYSPDLPAACLSAARDGILAGFNTTPPTPPKGGQPTPPTPSLPIPGFPPGGIVTPDGKPPEPTSPE